MDVIADDIAATAPQILALQEADTDCPPHAGVLDPDRIAKDTGLRHAQSSQSLRWGPRSHGFLGSVVFLHPGLTVEAAAVVDLPGHCHRGAAVFDLSTEGACFRLVVVHLSLAQWLRAMQLRTLAQFIRRRPALPLVLMGDLNEWRPWGGLALSPLVMGRKMQGPAVRSFPARAPILPLDRILSDRAKGVRGVRALNSPAIRAASDHLPLVAELHGLTGVDRDNMGA
jgi:endonuclease/exonuclease/phosphatase family metal-dependent hydrolase